MEISLASLSAHACMNMAHHKGWTPSCGDANHLGYQQERLQISITRRNPKLVLTVPEKPLVMVHPYYIRCAHMQPYHPSRPQALPLRQRCLHFRVSGSCSPHTALQQCRLPHAAHLDGHAGAVEALREQHILAQQPVVGGSKLELGQREGMTQVQHAVHVGVGEGAKVLGSRALGRGINLKSLGRLPPRLQGQQAQLWRCILLLQGSLVMAATRQSRAPIQQ